MMSSSCDKGAEGCTDSTACNYDETAAIDDKSCWYKSPGCDCEDPPGSVIDCLGICDADISIDPPIDSDGNCCSNLNENCEIIVVGGCKEKTNCKYSGDVTHNDGSCSPDLYEFGGTPGGCDCTNLNCDSDVAACGGAAVIDGCDLCVGGTTDYGQSWRIKITAVATFKLEDEIFVGKDTNSIILGTSIYASDGYNGGELNNSDPVDENNYIDIMEPPLTFLDVGRNNIRFFFPHDDNDDWDDWGSLVNPDFIPTLQFDRDIRANDYHALFTEEKGINWFAMIDPTFSDTTINVNEIPTQFIPIMDSIYFQISHLEGIKCSNIKFAIDREKGEIVSNFNHIVEKNQLGISVDSGKAITVTINVSNICIKEQGSEQGEELLETCPYDF